MISCRILENNANVASQQKNLYYIVNGKRVWEILLFLGKL